MDYKVLSIEQLVEECAERPTPEAWEEFIRRFHKLIAATVMRTLRLYGKSDPDLTEELVQDVYLKLCADDRAVLRRFKPLHENAFLGYLKKLTANLVLDYIRKHFPEDDKTDNLDEGVEQTHKNSDQESLEREIFFNRIDRILRERGNGPQEEKDRAIFWLYFRHGMTAKEIASIPAMKLTVKGVESCIFRLIVYIRKKLFGDRPGGDPGGIPPV
jgi:RNA polymerase sigma-70 factor (ECF subfamily)